MYGNRNPYALLLGTYIGKTTVGNNLDTANEIKCMCVSYDQLISYDPTVPPWVLNPEKLLRK